MKTAEIFSKAVGLDITSEDCYEVHLLRSTVETGLKAVEKAIKAQFKYDYSMSCKCKDSTGETLCCNVCGLPTSKHTQNNVISDSDKNLVREVLMRHQLLFPCNEQDLKWSEQKPDPELLERLLKYMKMDEPAKTYPSNIEPHYFVRHNLDTNDRFCDKCGLYFTDKIHSRQL